MPRAKKTSLIMEIANTRLAGVKSIDAKLDLGNGLSVAEYHAAIEAVRVALEAYNTVLSLVDEKQNDVIAKEKRLRDLHERILMGVAARHGDCLDSRQDCSRCGYARNGSRWSSPCSS